MLEIEVVRAKIDQGLSRLLSLAVFLNVELIYVGLGFFMSVVSSRVIGFGRNDLVVGLHLVVDVLTLIACACRRKIFFSKMLMELSLNDCCGSGEAKACPLLRQDV